MASPIKFLLDLDAKLGKLPTADNVLGRIIRSLQKLNPEIRVNLRNWNALAAGSAVFTRALGGVREGINMAGRQVGNFSRDALAHFTALASFNGLAMLARSAMGLGKSLITTVANGERADAVMKSLVGAETASRIDAWADKLSKVTEFDDDNIKRFAAGLLKVGVAADQLPDHLRIATDLAALTDTDNPSQVLAEIGHALENMHLKGGLDFKILRNAGISKQDFFGPLAKQMGVSIDEVEKRAGAGQIKLKALRDRMKAAITEKTGKGSGFTALERGAGFSASLDRLSRVPDDIFKRFKNTDASKQMAGAFERLASVLGPDGPVGKKIVEGIGAAFGATAKWLAGLDFNKIAADLQSFGADAMLVFKTVSTAASWVWKAFQAVGTFVGSAVAQVYLEFENLMSVGTKIGDFFGSIEVTIKDWASKLYESALSIGRRIWEGIKEGVSSRVSEVGGAMGALIKRLTGTTEEKLQIRSPSRVFERYGALTGEGFAKGLEGVDRQIAAAAERTYDIPAPAGMVSAAPRKAEARGGRGVTLNVPITVNYNGTGGPEAANEIAGIVRRIVEGDLQYAFDRLALETGSA